MPAIVTFIGWHNSGKTTLASQVVAHLEERGFRVAVIKSSKEEGIAMDRPDTDTDSYRRAGADSVTLLAPDQMVITMPNPGLNLVSLAHRFFSDMDIVIGEGFKEARQVAKIEVCRDPAKLLRDRVTGVIAIATDCAIAGDHVFRLDESRELADFLEKRFLGERRGSGQDRVLLLVNGNRVVLKDFVQEALAGSVTGFLASLKIPRPMQEIELKIRLRDTT